MSNLPQYIRIKKSKLVDLYKQLNEKNAYIKKLELALASVERQVDNTKDLNEK